ncbi:dipeptide ABC transporter ATP-binding protein [Actinokineospora guangxiensis]|uniref:Dipeptide ABC transporter ATP-binding protein n=1 Tax=Actinokineospora guangxiensis TaxID=1490288 RepID=A0ABW0ETX3_9PSEU
MNRLLEIRDLRVVYRHRGAEVTAVRGLSLDLDRGESLALVGESGSGKSATALAVLGLLPATAGVRGSVRLDGRELVGMSDRDLSAVRGARIGFVHQDPLGALTPVIPVGAQIAEAVAVHRPGIGRRAATARAVALLDSVGIAAKRAGALPHEFSGGMRQRVAIAAAIACDPDLIIADEPTSALDVTVQAQILDLLDDVRARTGAALLLITHDLGVVARSCDRVAVLHRGEMVEEGPVGPLFASPGSDRLRELVSAVDLPVRPDAPAGETVLRITGLRRHFRQGRATVRAVDGVDLDLAAGQALALLGESGCGKTTVLRQVIGLRAPQSGSVELFGRDLSALRRRDRADLRARVQVVTQDPTSSLNPVMDVADLIAEPLRIQGRGRAESRSRARELVELVGLPADCAARRPGQLSGGQRQRVAIARALAPGPRLVLLDEPVSALDMSLRAGIMDLLTDLRHRLGLAFLVVSHDLPLTRRSVERVAVMYSGKVVEAGPVADVLDTPSHPYTRALVAATPTLSPSARPVPLVGEPPDPLTRERGCAFRPRCPIHPVLSAVDRAVCAEVAPRPQPLAGKRVACHHARAAGAAQPSAVPVMR